MALPEPLTKAIDSYNTWSEEQLLAQQTATAVDTTLYHYTNAVGLKGILESQTIWFTDYRVLNDPSELVHGIEMCGEVIRGLSSGSDQRVVEFLDIVKRLMSQKNFAGRLDFFIASFSRARDDLGQWRAYADDGRGFALGLSPYLFAVQEKRGKQPDDNLFVGPVVYHPGQVCERHSEPLQRAIDLLLAEIKSGNLDEDVIREEFLDSLAKSAVASSLIWNCLTAKHPAYQHEQEVRLIILGTHWVLRPFIKTRIRGSNIVPYIAHEMLVRAPHSISNIVVGPTAPPDAERTVRTLLESLDIDSALPVSRSDVPYRAV